MRRDEDNSIAVVVIALMLSAFLVFISRPSGSSALISMVLSIKQSLMQPMVTCQPSYTDEIVGSGSQ